MDKIDELKERAERGDGVAQVKLANIYFGLEDYKETYKWCLIATARGHPNKNYRNLVMSSASSLIESGELSKAKLEAAKKYYAINEKLWNELMDSQV